MNYPPLYPLFRINDRPWLPSPGQIQIFDLVRKISTPRVQVIAPTQYGKSLTIALGALIGAISIGDRFTILAPSEKKARIIMEYAIEHVFDSEIFLHQLELDPTITLDRLRKERSRTNLNFASGGGLMVLTLDARNSKNSLSAAMGFGSNRVILDESSLIDDTLYASVKRMLGGYTYKEQFLLEIGNPFYRNHFFRTWNDPAYTKIFIDYHQGLKEGRYSPEFIEEMRREAFFDVYYECKFPDEEAVDRQGYRFLFASGEIAGAQVHFDTATDLLKSSSDTVRLGADIGGGGDYNVYALRKGNIAMVVGKNQSRDTMTNVVELENLMSEYEIKPENVFIDDIGIGRGVSDRLKEKGKQVNGIAVGGLPVDKSKFLNIKAENAWNMKMWISAGGKIVETKDIEQLGWIKYKVNTDKVLSLEPKDQLVMRSGKSPDVYDALALTFCTPPPEISVRFI